MMGGAPNYMYTESEVVPYDEGDENFYENQQQWEPRRGAKAADDEHINVTDLPLAYYATSRRTLIQYRLYKKRSPKRLLQVREEPL